MAADAQLRFEVALDLQQIEEVTQVAAELISKKLVRAFSEMGHEGEESSKTASKGVSNIGRQSKVAAVQVQGLGGTLKKLGAMLAGAFAVKKVFDFGKSCIELGSDLAEVQNVVDVTFPQMSKQVDKFAQNAATQFGLSETMAKRFTGTFGAMAKAFGFSEKAAYDMSTTLTGLA